MEAQKWTLESVVPTVFQALRQYMRTSKPGLSSTRIMNTGGAACPPLLLEVLTGPLRLYPWECSHLVWS